MLAQQQIESVFLRPSNIASRRFTRSRDGYDLEEVHQFLEDVADYLSRLEGELEWRRALRTRQTGTIYEQKEAISVVTEARKQAERIMADARRESEGYIRLARAIAHQLALEAQARRPQVALAVTRASGSSSTVEGFQNFDDMEVWVDPSLLDLTKSGDTAPHEGGGAPDTEAHVDAADSKVAAAETSTSEGASASDVADAGDAMKSNDVVLASDDPPTGLDALLGDASTGGVATPDAASSSDRKSKKKSKRKSKHNS